MLPRAHVMLGDGNPPSDVQTNVASVFSANAVGTVSTGLPGGSKNQTMIYMIKRIRIKLLSCHLTPWFLCGDEILLNNICFTSNSHRLYQIFIDRYVIRTD